MSLLLGGLEVLWVRKIGKIGTVRGTRGRERKMEGKMDLLDELNGSEMRLEGEMGGEGGGLGLESATGLGGAGAQNLDEKKEDSEERDGVKDQVLGRGEDEDAMGDAEKHGTDENGDGGDGDSEEENAQFDAVKDRSDVQREENELPVLRDTGDVYAEQDCSTEKKVLRSEIPDSEADTDEAISPVKATVESRIQVPKMDERDDGQDVTSMDDTPEAPDVVQNVENEATASVEVERSPAPSNKQTTQESETEALPINPMHQDSSAVSFVDDEAMIILPRFTTSDLQPTHTPTQTQTQEEEVVNSHFADAVAVMSDIGGGTQDVMSSMEEAVLQGGDIDMDLSGKGGHEVPPTGEIEVVHEAATTAEAVAEDGHILSQPREDIPSETTADVVVEPISSQTALEKSSVSEPHLAAQKEGSVPDSAKDEDVMMSDDLPEIQQIAAIEGPIHPEREAGLAEDEESRVKAQDLSTSKTNTTRSIPDSDDDEEEFPDAHPISKSEEKVGSTSGAPVISPSTTNELAAETRVPERSSSLEVSDVSKPNLPPKTPKTSFKAPNSSPTTSPKSTEPTASTSKPGGTILSPNKNGDKKKKTSSKTLPASGGSQNKDVLMAELKAIKIVSYGLSDDGSGTDKLQASIQARNASLEAEIKKKRARLEEVSKELK